MARMASSTASVDKKTPSAHQHHTSMASKNARIMDDNYDRRLQALFEAIIAEDIHHRPSADDAKNALK